MNLADALARFLVQLEADGRSPHTVAQYRRHIRLLARWLEAERRPQAMAAITHEVLAAFLTSPAARTTPEGERKKATAMNCLRSSLRTFFEYSYRAAYAPANPAAVIKRAMCGSPPPRSLSGADQEKLLATLSAAEGHEALRDHLLFHLMLATGIRLQSALGLEATDFDLDHGELTLPVTKGNRPEVVFLGEGIREHLRRYMAASCSNLLFAARNGCSLTSRHVERRFAEWLQKAGITKPASPHWLRHSFATDLYRRTGDILLVKEALGHRSISSTLVYARGDQDRLRKTMV